MTTDNDSQVLLLDAFRYFNREMSDAERDAFDQLLAEDLAAQSALADVVLIQAGLDARTSVVQSVYVRKQPAESRFAAFLGGAVALIVLLSALVILSPNSSREAGLVANHTPELGQVDLDAVGVWTQLESDSNVAATLRQSDADLDEVRTNRSTENQVDVPDWMVAAVQASATDVERSEFDSDFGGGTL